MQAPPKLLQQLVFFHTLDPLSLDPRTLPSLIPESPPTSKLTALKHQPPEKCADLGFRLWGLAFRV